MKMLLPLYGIPESGTYWFNTYQPYYIITLGITVSTFDPCLIFHGTPKDEVNFAVLGLQTDDTCFAAGKIFAKKEQEELRKRSFWPNQGKR